MNPHPLRPFCERDIDALTSLAPPFVFFKHPHIKLCVVAVPNDFVELQHRFDNSILHSYPFSIYTPNARYLAIKALNAIAKATYANTRWPDSLVIPRSIQ